MSIFSLFSRKNITQEVEHMRNIPGAILLDVRSQAEYKSGHIPGGINIPLETISDIEKIAANHETPIFIYCLRGSRSLRAAGILRNLGYHNVKSIGGIKSYKGELER